MLSLVPDLRHGFRILARSPGFAAAAILSIALGIGANATVFTWLKSLVLLPLPGAQTPDRLLTMNRAQGARDGWSTSYRDYLYYRDHNHVFSALAAHEMTPVNLSREGKPELVMAGVVSANYFDVLGVTAAAGRTFLPDEERTAQPVAVLSYGLWARRFGADPKIVGQSVSLNSQPFTIVGVASREFRGAYGGIAQELWAPLAVESRLAPGGDQIGRGTFPVQIIGRLKPGVTFAQAQANVHVMAQQTAQTYLENKGWDEILYPLSRSQKGIQSSLAPFVTILMAVVGLVLLIACINVSNLLLARAGARRKEIGIRLALGAGRSRLVRQLLAESAVLAGLGGAAGLLLTFWTADKLLAFVPALGVSFGLDLTVDARVAGFLLAVTVVAGALFGLAPALESSRPDLAIALREESGSIAGGRRRSWLRNALVVGQISLSLTALVGAGLFARSLQKALEARPGFDSGNLLLTSFDLFLNGYDDARGAEFASRLILQIESLPGVQAATVASYVPLGLSGGGNSRRISIDGYTPRADEDLAVTCDSAGPQYFKTMGIPLVEGRDFGWEDRANARSTVIINQTMAHRYFPGQDPVGKHFKIGDHPHEIVGVARDVKYRSIDEDPSPQMYLPILQQYESQMILVVRTAGDPHAALSAVQSEVARLNPDLALFGAMTYTQRTAYSLFPQQLATKLLAMFGVVALLLAAIGLYGVMAYFVSQRRREIAIRMALGAVPGDVLRMVVSQGMRVASIGIAIGLAAAFAVTRLLSGLLYQVTATDPLIFTAVPLVLAAVALVASYVPARRASAVDPMAALRSE